MDDFKRRLDAAEGYFALGMAREAWAETEEIEPEQRASMPVCLLRVHILNHLEHWEAAASLGRGAMRCWPSVGDFYLSTAYAVRRWVGVEEAQTLLLLGEEILRPQAIWHYNLACYLAVLGDFAGARERLKTAFALEPKYRLTALDDEDLRALWAAL